MLKDKKILITRPEGQSRSWIQNLRELGANPIALPLIEIKPICSNEIIDAVTHIERYDWLLFTSANGVRSFMSWLHNNEIQPVVVDLPSIAVVGKATASEIFFYGHAVDLIPSNFTGTDLALAMGEVRGKKILIPGSTISGEELPKILREKGAIVDSIPVYDNVQKTDNKKWLKKILLDGIDVVTLASPSAVRAFVEMEGPAHTNAIYACIGPITAENAKANGLNVEIIAEPYTAEGLTDAMLKYFSDERKSEKITD